MSEPSPDAQRPDQATLRFLDVDGVRLRVSVRGAGAPLLIITGLGASLDLAAPFERELTARGIQAISFDAPGVGESTGYRWPQRMPGIARTDGGLLDALGYDRVDVLGVSLGGVIAQQFAHQSPDRVRRLVLCATGPGVVGLGGMPGSPRRSARAWPPAAGTPHPTTTAGSPGALYGGRGPHRPGRAAARLDRPVRPRRRACAAISVSSTRSASGPGFPGCGGSASPPWSSPVTTTPSSRSLNGRILARCIPDARLHIMQGGGHLFLLERPAETAELVADFLHEPTEPGRSDSRPIDRTAPKRRSANRHPLLH